MLEHALTGERLHDVRSLARARFGLSVCLMTAFVAKFGHGIGLVDWRAGMTLPAACLIARGGLWLLTHRSAGAATLSGFALAFMDVPVVTHMRRAHKDTSATP